MTLYLGLPGSADKLQQLTSLTSAQILPTSPSGLDEVPTNKALICVADMGSYETAAYIISERDFANWVNPRDNLPKTWLLIDRQIADELCPDAPRHRQHWESALADDAEAAAHTDNLIPVARADRLSVLTHIDLLRRWAAVLRGKRQGNHFDDLLTDAGVRRIAATDLEVVAKDLEAWIEHDWIAVIHIGADRENLEGPLPPFPDIPSRGTD